MKWSTGWLGVAQAGLEEAVLDLGAGCQTDIQRLGLASPTPWGSEQGPRGPTDIQRLGLALEAFDRQLLYTSIPGNRRVKQVSVMAELILEILQELEEKNLKRSNGS
ncbi:hypothetical protein AAFF_G00391010 [Aldrovandia affinis]|uniref:Uncharacterized protein n=1 Tax=Aldrovandia affinis TaxID=143900 RepID=A0AAD7VYW5_9TELE|nr:hypothetical protein AAFF_G00391010 [Aldrovandia affinis]